MKFFIYVFLISGIIVLLNAGGFGLPSGELLETILNSDSGLAGIEQMEILTRAEAILTLVAGAGLVASLFRQTPDVTLLKGSFVLWFMSMYIIDLIFLYKTLFGYGTIYSVLASLIFIPLTIGFIVTSFEWWTGAD